MRVEVVNREFKIRIASGTLRYVDNQVDVTTGTVRFKAVFPNTDNALFPNQFVNARLLLDTRRKVILASAGAIQRGPQTTFVFLVKTAPWRHAMCEWVRSKARRRSSNKDCRMATLS